MTSAGQALQAQAAERFPDATDAEKKLFLNVTTGKVADCSSAIEDQNDPAQADIWAKPRTIRAEAIRWLCVDREAQRKIDPRGILIHAAKIEGVLDLQSVSVPFPLVLERCAGRRRAELRRNSPAEFPG